MNWCRKFYIIRGLILRVHECHPCGLPFRDDDDVHGGHGDDVRGGVLRSQSDHGDGGVDGDDDGVHLSQSDDVSGSPNQRYLSGDRAWQTILLLLQVLKLDDHACYILH